MKSLKEQSKLTKQAVSVQGRKVASHGRKLFSSLYKLFYSCGRTVVLHVRGTVASAGHRIGRSFQNFARWSRRVGISTKRAYKTVTGRCATAARDLGQEVVHVCLGIGLGTKRLYKSFVGGCAKSLRKTVRAYHAVRIGTKRAYKSFTGGCRERLVATGKKTVDVCKKVGRGCNRIRIETKRAYKNISGRCAEAVVALGVKAVATSKRVARGCNRVRIGVKRAYRNFTGRCRERLVATGERTVASCKRMGRGWNRVRIDTKRAYKNFTGHCAEVFVAIGEKTVRVCNRIRRGVKNISARSAEGFTTAEEKIVSTLQRGARGWNRVRIGTKRAYKNLTGHCAEVFVAIGEKTVSVCLRTGRGCNRIRIESKRAYKNFRGRCREGFVASIEAISSGYGRVQIGTKRAYNNFTSRCSELCIVTVQKATKGYNRVRIDSKNLYRSIKVWSAERFAAAGEKTAAVCRKMVRGCNRVRIGTKRFYKDVKGRCGEEATAALQRGVAIYQRVRIPTYRFAKNIFFQSRHLSKRAGRAIGMNTKKLGRGLVVLAKSTGRTVQWSCQKLGRELSIAGRKTAIAVRRVRRSFRIASRRGAESLSRGWQQRVAAMKKSAVEATTIKIDKVIKPVKWEIPLQNLKASIAEKTAQLSAWKFKAPQMSWGTKQWVGLLLISVSSAYVTIVAFFSKKPALISTVSSGGAPVSTIESPPLAVIGYMPEPTKGAASGKPRKYSFYPKRFDLRHVQGWGDQRSLGTDYTTASLFIAPDYREGKIMPIVDLRGHRFDNGLYAANIGIAGRYIPKPGSFSQMLGMNLFYDFRQSKKGNYHQLGLGLEVLGSRWDLRANGYVPISTSEFITTCPIPSYIGNFFLIQKNCEFISYGYNAEAGYYIIRGTDFFLYAAGGPYYLTKKNRASTSGGEFRIRPQYKDYLALDLSISHDNSFGTVYQAQIVFSLPLYQLSKNLNKRPGNLLDMQIYQPIDRFEVMPLGRRSCWQYNF